MWHLINYHYLFVLHTDSPPSKSPGRNELRDDGVARCWSCSLGFDVPHKLPEDMDQMAFA